MMNVFENSGITNGCCFNKTAESGFIKLAPQGVHFAILQCGGIIPTDADDFHILLFFY
jgi:hypothetical protein